VGYASSGALGLAQGAAGVALNAASQVRAGLVLSMTGGGGKTKHKKNDANRSQTT